MCVSGNNIFVGNYGYGVFRSTNNGANWVPITNGILTRHVNDLASIGTNIFVSFDNGGIYRTTDSGNNWVHVYDSLNSPFIWKFAVHNNLLFAGLFSYGTAFTYGIYRSSNYGSIWHNASTGLPIYETIYSFTVSGQNIFASCTKGVYRTTNDGDNWYSFNNGISDLSIWSLGSIGSYIFASTYEGVIYRSSNSGMSWYEANNGLPNSGKYTFTSNGTNIFTGSVGIYLSTNNGENWINRNQGFSYTPRIESLIIAGNYIFAGTMDSSIWRRSLSEIIEVKNVSQNIPSIYSLHQNYPNPFNPTTNIRYQIKDSKFVIVKVLDIMGREVETLVKEKQTPGVYEVKFDGTNYPSGIYFYKLNVDGYSETRKMILLK